MKKLNICLAILALLLILPAGIGEALAYFTTYTQAKGGYTIELGDQTRTHIDESFSNWTKRVTISNEEDSQPVYVRARAYSGSIYQLNYSSAGGKWAPNGNQDGFYYYSDILNPGERSEELLVKIENIPEGTDEASFNVTVIYEYTPVRYDDDGNPYADWTMTFDPLAAQLITLPDNLTAGQNQAPGANDAFKAAASAREGGAV
ncbi:MAG: hypothetical protein HFI35_13770 [Roseburia sp.]|jgi:hypothetical protein|nr:hypothetical protein [Roseburia sp.]